MKFKMWMIVLMRLILNRFWQGELNSCVRRCDVIPFSVVGKYVRLGGACYFHILP
jgi:hypothetical protein